MAHGIGIRAAVNELVLLPRLADEPSHLLEVLPLDGLVHVLCMGFHGPQLVQFATMVEEHAAHDFSQDSLGSTGDARIVQQVTRRIFRLREDVVGQPAHQRCLVEATLRLQQLHTT